MHSFIYFYVFSLSIICTYLFCIIFFFFIFYYYLQCQRLSYYQVNVIFLFNRKFVTFFFFLHFRFIYFYTIFQKYVNDVKNKSIRKFEMHKCGKKKNSKIEYNNNINILRIAMIDM